MATVDSPRQAGAGGRSNPRSGNYRKARKQRRRGFWHHVGTFFTAVGIVILVGVLGITAIIAYRLRHTPTTASLIFSPKGRTQILSADGVLLARVYTENRVVVPIENIPKNLQNATIAFEDKRFYQHSGIDAEGIARSIWLNIKNHDLLGQGGSTLEQQLARNIGVEGLTSEKSVSRKLHEWIVAEQIERTFSKQEILEMYLNQVNYGSGAWGVEAASQTYFGKHVQDLDLAQCALLAGLPNRPTVYNPYRDITLATGQRDRVLEQMVEQGYISHDQYTQAYNEPIRLAFRKAPAAGSQIYSAPYFVNYVIDQLKREYGEDELEQGNLRVYTSLNFQMQQAAEQIVHSSIDPNNQDGPNQACLVAIDPKTGEIKAMVGGLDYKTSEFNLVSQAKFQPGSLFKVIVYAAAIDSGLVTKDQMVYDTPETYKSGNGEWTPKDDGPYSYRAVSLTDAMANSINVPAVKVLNMMGPPTAVRYAHVMGINDDTPLDPVLSLALGSSAVSPLEMTDVYATVANGGNHPEPMGIVRLTDPNDNTIEDLQPSIDQGVLEPGTVSQLNDMLRAVVTGGTGTGADNIPDARGKTGTTQEHKDVWFIGYTPDLVVGVWAGHLLRNRRPGQDSYRMSMPSGNWGATVCVPIWDKFMLKALPIIKAEKAREASKQGPPEGKLTATGTSQQNSPTQTAAGTSKPGAVKPGSAGTPSTDSEDDVETVNIDNDSGLLAPDGAPNSHMETFAKDAAPTKMSPQYVNSGAVTSKSPTDDVSGASQPATAPAAAAPTPPPAVAPKPAVTPNSQPATGAPHPLAPTSIMPTAPAATASQTTLQAAPPKPVAVAVIPRHVEPETVTVLINPEDGLLATQWDPVVVQRTYMKGKEPNKHSTMYAPPPGEH